ncbi:MAG: hypothetical protein AAFV53_38990 [Myxococcota bacterium]
MERVGTDEASIYALFIITMGQASEDVSRHGLRVALMGAHDDVIDTVLMYLDDAGSQVVAMDDDLALFSDDADSGWEGVDDPDTADLENRWVFGRP